MNWAHGRQAADENAPHRVPEHGPKRRQGFTESLTTEEHKVLAKHFTAIRKGKSSPCEPETREIVDRLLHGLANDRIDSRADL
jgi:hypothetical protein